MGTLTLQVGNEIETGLLVPNATFIMTTAGNHTVRVVLRNIFGTWELQNETIVKTPFNKNMFGKLSFKIFSTARVDLWQTSSKS